MFGGGVWGGYAGVSRITAARVFLVQADAGRMVLKLCRDAERDSRVSIATFVEQG